MWVARSGDAVSWRRWVWLSAGLVRRTALGAVVELWLYIECECCLSGRVVIVLGCEVITGNVCVLCAFWSVLDCGGIEVIDCTPRWMQ